MKRHTMLYFGSFNPVHRAHVAVAEYVVEQELCDEAVLVVSPRNPLKDAAGLAPEADRFAMVEIACAGSKYPDRIVPSGVEFLLPKPSYTASTLRYLTDRFGSEKSFSLLMGSDLAAQLDRWRDPDYILDNFPVYVYPRTGAPTPQADGRLRLLEGAPSFDCSSTSVRQALEAGRDASAMLPAGVADYIRRNGLWSPEWRIERLNRRIEAQPEDASLYMERAACRYRRGEWGEALNDYARADALAPNPEARQMMEMIRSILDFRYKDIYNP